MSRPRPGPRDGWDPRVRRVVTRPVDWPDARSACHGAPGRTPQGERSVPGARPGPHPAAAETARPRRPRGTSVNKAELVTAISKRADVPSATVDAVLSGLQEELVEAITRGEKVAVSGLLTVERTQRSARTGRNPQTGESIEIPAANTVKVTAGSNLKKAASNVPV
ncbi:HU family DNA-binding protein [Geodermatophilus sp. SYSU D01119]